MKVIKLVLTLLGMHIVGSSILFGYVSGPEAILAGPLLSIFGLYLIPFEAIALIVIWAAYNPQLNQKITKTIKSGLIASLIFGVTVAPLIPKEENNELTFWVAGLLGGICAGLFAFTCINQIKKTELKFINEQNTPNPNEISKTSKFLSKKTMCIVSILLVSYGFYYWKIVGIENIDSKINRRLSLYTIDEIQDDLIFSMPIKNKRVAVEFAKNNGLLKLPPYEKLEKRGFKKWYIRAKKREDRWFVDIKSKDILPSYKCTMVFNDIGEIHYQTCQYNK